jgi:hypothetical protein
MPAKVEAQKICFQRGLAAGGVTKTGFSDVTIITGETEALGHGVYVDEGAIDGLMSLLLGKSLPGYLTHDGAMWRDRLGGEIGVFSGFYRDADSLKIKAKTFKFLNSFMKHEQEEYETLVELAEIMPDQFGLSVVFSGDLVWVLENGEEVSAALPMPEGVKYEMPCVRFATVESADFVKAPAANPDGLFAAKVDVKPNGMADTILLVDHQQAFSALKSEHESALSALNKSIADAQVALAAKESELSALSVKVGALEEAAKGHAAELAKIAGERDEAMKFDMRKAGVRHGDAPQGSAELPTQKTAFDSDRDRWAHYHALKEKDAFAAEEFRKAHIAGRARL